MSFLPDCPWADWIAGPSLLTAQERGWQAAQEHGAVPRLSSAQVSTEHPIVVIVT